MTDFARARGPLLAADSARSTIGSETAAPRVPTRRNDRRLKRTSNMGRPRSMVERKVLGVQQCPEQVAEHLVLQVAGGQHVLHSLALVGRRQARDGREEHLVGQLVSVRKVLEPSGQFAVPGPDLL